MRKIYGLFGAGLLFMGCASDGSDDAMGGKDAGGITGGQDAGMMTDSKNPIPHMEMKDSDGGMTMPGSEPSAGSVGASCTMAEMCQGEMAGCITEWPGGYCSIASCEPDSCPAGSECYQLSNGDTRCFRECMTRDDCREGYACHSVGACVPACTATSCEPGETCGEDGLCKTAPCQDTGCAEGLICATNGSCIIDLEGGPGAGPGPDCDALLPERDCAGADCTMITAFTPVMGPGYDNYPLNGETADNQYRSYANQTLQMLVKYAAAYVACKSETWTEGNGQPIGLGDMSEADGAIPGTSIGQPGHPEGTHVNGRDMDIGYYQLTSPDNYLRPICPYTSGGADQSHCVGEPDNLDVWRTALFLGALLTGAHTRVIGVDGRVGPYVEQVLPALCAEQWLPQAACDNMHKLAFETTNMGLGWYYFHHHHLHVSTQ